ncbi:hypothetical protein BS639_19840 [Rouxiella silvae]|uniref:Type VI secretion system baseplate subunit TssE n=1 Tax=Rouxiella silvae TaxID=1646373 RepID=A0AA41BWC5_9GAMM|nr:type VI secretion system baseplate subunit TssE [Rouxiella silvae]MBF6637095.1 type VI secretion system baseplate subunit TssE [Rouxiella silvae]ORJ19482.1 hypothetical protein BS639_19840 [Rouxiella silvae]
MKPSSIMPEGDDLYRTGYQARENNPRLTHRDTVQPALLDRLTDDEPEKREFNPAKNVMTHSQLRRQVLRDLQWLFNCVNNEQQHDLDAFAQVRSSVLNFGVAPLAGKRMSDIEWNDIQKRLTQAIINFEPRIIARDLQVKCMTDPKSLDTHNILSIEIKGNLWCVPWPLEFLFRTDIDLEIGRFELKDIG